MSRSFGRSLELYISNRGMSQRLGFCSTQQLTLMCSYAQTLQVRVMAEGDRNRVVGATALNVQSSRSHSVVTIVVEGRDRNSGEGTRAKLQLVDLAGSERVAISGAEGERLKEAQMAERWI